MPISCRLEKQWFRRSLFPLRQEKLVGYDKSHDDYQQCEEPFVTRNHVFSFPDS